MGFFANLGKIIQGKPVYTADNASKSSSRTFDIYAARGEKSPVDEQGNKVIPNVTLEHCKTHFMGKNIQVTAWVQNNSDFEIELDRILMLRKKIKLDRHMHPGEGHEVKLYRGPILTHDNDTRAKLEYKLVDGGDYFCADFQIEFNRERDNEFSVEQFHPERIRDI